MLNVNANPFLNTKVVFTTPELGALSPTIIFFECLIFIPDRCRVHYVYVSAGRNSGRYANMKQTFSVLGKTST